MLASCPIVLFLTRFDVQCGNTYRINDSIYTDSMIAHPFQYKGAVKYRRAPGTGAQPLVRDGQAIVCSSAILPFIFCTRKNNYL